MHANYTSTGRVSVSLAEGEALAHVAGPITIEITPQDGLILWDALKASGLPIAPIPVTSGAVDDERDRRMAYGVTFNGKVYQTRDFDIANMTGAATAAIAAMMQGAQAGDLRWSDAGVDFAWIATDNTAVPMDAPTMISLAQAAMNRRATFIFVARTIKDRIASGETLDVTSDALWPAM